MPGTSLGTTIDPLFRRVGGRRRGGGGWGRRRLGGGGLLFHHPHGNDRAFVERQQRDRERGLAEHIGRRQHGGDDECDHDEIAALVAQLLRGDDADPPQQRQD